MNDQAILGMLVQKIGSANWSQWQIQRWQWYDYVRMTVTGASNLSLSFFSNPLGSTDPVAATAKTLEQTNIVKPNSFGQQYFIIQQIRTQLQPLVKARQTTALQTLATHSFDQGVLAGQLRAVYSTGVLNLVIGQKAYFDIVQPFRHCPPGFGVGNDSIVVPFDHTAGVAGNTYVAQSNNLADVYALTPPQLVEPEQTFQCTIDFPDLGYNFHNVCNGSATDCAMEAGVILDGYLARPVQ